MKCDDFLPSLETGGFWTRVRAHLHAARCNSCAAERQQWRALRQEWARPPQLSAAHRALWEQTAELSSRDLLRSEARSQPITSVRWGMAASALLLVVGGSLLLTLRNDKSPAEVVAIKQPVDDPAWHTTSASTNALPLEQIERSLDELAAELRKLGREAEVLDARRDLDRLSTIYRPLSPTDTSQAIPN